MSGSIFRNYSLEITLVVLIVAAGAWANVLSPFFLEPSQIAYSMQQSIAVLGILAAGMTIVIAMGEIDLSLPATMALCNMLFSLFVTWGVPLAISFPAVLIVAAAIGALNGIIVVSLGLPAIAVTLGTMGMVRALAFLVGGQAGFFGFGESYIWLGSVTWLNELLPVSLMLLLIVFGGLALLLHGTTYGRYVFMVGAGAKAVTYAGVRVRLVKIVGFSLASTMAGLASLVYIGQYQSARADNAADMLLPIITACTLGGMDIFGGRGRVFGVLLALVFIGTLKNGMGLANIAGPVQTFVIGALLIASLFFNSLTILLGSRWRAVRIQRKVNKEETT